MSENRSYPRLSTWNVAAKTAIIGVPVGLEDVPCLTMMLRVLHECLIRGIKVVSATCSEEGGQLYIDTLHEDWYMFRAYIPTEVEVKFPDGTNEDLGHEIDALDSSSFQLQGDPAVFSPDGEHLPKCPPLTIYNPAGKRHGEAGQVVVSNSDGRQPLERFFRILQLVERKYLPKQTFMSAAYTPESSQIMVYIEEKNWVGQFAPFAGTDVVQSGVGVGVSTRAQENFNFVEI
ncbi:hypothetical protein CC2G_014414 [Coprinopsis cinerea AmutBmut pab1-1]|nr:hypothetical protein CC2G_014414 [Coprinopsis cinerea AmutBmut pab1-1]